jgi:hypothetical protein
VREGPKPYVRRIELRDVPDILTNHFPTDLPASDIKAAFDARLEAALDFFKVAGNADKAELYRDLAFYLIDTMFPTFKFETTLRSPKRRGARPVPGWKKRALLKAADNAAPSKRARVLKETATRLGLRASAKGSLENHVSAARKDAPAHIAEKTERALRRRDRRAFYEMARMAAISAALKSKPQ